MSITALGMALAYLLPIVAGTIEALFTMIWLFRETAVRLRAPDTKPSWSLANAGRLEIGSKPTPQTRIKMGDKAPQNIVSQRSIVLNFVKNLFQADNRNCLYLSHVRLTRPLFANARECCVKRSCPLDCRPVGRRGSSNKSPKVKSQ